MKVKSMRRENIPELTIVLEEESQGHGGTEFVPNELGNIKTV